MQFSIYCHRSHSQAHVTIVIHVWVGSFAKAAIEALSLSSETIGNIRIFRRIAETFSISTVPRDRAGLAGNPAFAVNISKYLQLIFLNICCVYWLVTEDFALNKSTGLLHTAPASVWFLAFPGLVLTSHPAVTVVSPAGISSAQLCSLYFRLTFYSHNR